MVFGEHNSRIAVVRLHDRTLVPRLHPETEVRHPEHTFRDRDMSRWFPEPRSDTSVRIPEIPVCHRHGSGRECDLTIAVPDQSPILESGETVRDGLTEAEVFLDTPVRKLQGSVRKTKAAVRIFPATVEIDRTAPIQRPEILCADE